MPPSNTNTPRQQSLTGMEPEHPEVDYRIERWLEHKAKAEEAAAVATAADEAVAQAMLEHAVPYRAYTDPKSGKRKYRYVDRSPRLKSVAARPEARGADEASVSENVPLAPVSSDDAERTSRARTPVDEVEYRRVSRVTVDAELTAIAEETRRADDRSPMMEQGAAAVDGALRPARRDDDEEREVAIPEDPSLLELYETPEVAKRPVNEEPKPAPIAASQTLVEESDEEQEHTLEMDGGPTASASGFFDDVLKGDVMKQPATECGNTNTKMGAPCHLPEGHAEGETPTLHSNGKNAWKSGRPRREAKK